ncbi:MAG: DNA primase [Oscillospiraceae bacterium]|nr:DNA primase [Oscillospiraceae bacterium]MBQ7082102.1 DNA primase [Oscillospiraceae bacterium]MBR6607282.1 DNA primase [Oscillospiraceae bacterium]
MLSESFISELKARNDIEEVISSYVNVKRRGRNLVGLCPFHSEKTPSFTVYPDSQSFYCFGCGAGGDVVTFVKKIENLDYIEAVKSLAQRAGLAMPEDGYDDSYAKLKTRVLEINRETARFYHQCLISPVGKKALEYLRGRGLSDNTIRRFGLGFAPESWDAVIKHLRGKGFTLDEMAAAAVAVKSARGSYYDQFRGRVIFPIIDIRGNVIAFGGRLMDGQGPKYLNSPDTPVFKKSRNLFALNYAKSSKESALILAEGYMDVVALHQAGFTNAVATLGTALTAEQARMISQYAAEVVIAYDSDGAGQKATNRAINIFGEIGLPVRVLKVQDAKDPDEFIKKFGATRFKMLLEGAGSAMEFEIAKLRAKYDLDSPDGKVGFLKEFAGFMAGIRNPIERDVYVTKTAQELGVAKDPLLVQINYIIRQRAKSDEKKKARDLSVFASGPNERRDPQRMSNLKEALAEERLIGILLKNPDYHGDILGKIRPEDFVTDFNREIFSVISDRLGQNRSVELIALSEQLSEEQMAKVAQVLADSASTRATRKEAMDYVETILAGKNRKSAAEVQQMDREALKDYVAQMAKRKKETIR